MMCHKTKSHKKSGLSRASHMGSTGAAWILLLYLAVIAVLALPLGYSFDLSELYAPWLRRIMWGQSPYTYWGFGTGYLLLMAIDWAMSSALTALGLSPASAMHLAYKVPLVIGTIAALAGLVRLSQRLEPRSKGRESRLIVIAAAWALSYSVVWVSGGSGQIEPIEAALIVWSVVFGCEGRWLLAGAVCGIGIGVEYVAIAAAALPVTMRLAGRLRWRSVGSMGAGIALGASASFGPNLLSAVGRRSLLDAIVGHASLAPANVVKVRSVWGLLASMGLPPFGAAYWYILVAVLGGVALSVLAFRASRTSEGDSALRLCVGSVSAVMWLFIVLDPLSLPQFGVLIVLGALLVYPMDHRVVAAGSLVAAADIASTFASPWGATWYNYVADVVTITPSIRRTLLPPFIPTTSDTHHVLGSIVAEGTVVLIGMAVLRRGGGPHGAIGSSRLVAVAIGLNLLLVAVTVVWTSQPALWAGVAGMRPRQLKWWAGNISHVQLVRADAAGRTWPVPKTLLLGMRTSVAWPLVEVSVPGRAEVSLVAGTSQFDMGPVSSVEGTARAGGGHSVGVVFGPRVWGRCVNTAYCGVALSDALGTPAPRVTLYWPYTRPKPGALAVAVGGFALIGSGFAVGFLARRVWLATLGDA